MNVSFIYTPTTHILFSCAEKGLNMYEKFCKLYIHSENASFEFDE